MVYVIAVLMGYFMGTNHLVQKKTSGSIGAAYADPILGKLSSIGFLGGWFCILPAAYFVSASFGNDYLNGIYFVLASLAGALISGLLQIGGLNYLLSAFALFLNIGLAVFVYIQT